MYTFEKAKIFSYKQFYSDKNKSIFYKTLYMIMFILGSFFLSIIVLQVLGYDGAKAINFIFTRPFDSFVVKDFISNLSILGIAGLAFAIGYKSGIFNIGISGQMMSAGIVITYIARSLTIYEEKGGSLQITGSFLGNSGWVFLLFIAFLVGALVAMISGVLKIFFKVHEVVSTILLNWVIFFIFKFFTKEEYLNPNTSTSTISTHESFTVGYIASIVILIVLAIFFFLLFKFTIFGKKITCVGKSINASSYSGYKINIIQLSSFLISGGIAGLLATMVYSKSGTLVLVTPLVDILPLEGFNGIAISMVSFSNPIAIIPVSFFISMISTSSVAAPPFPNSLGDFITGLIMYGTAIFSLAYQIKLLDRFKKMLSKTKWFKNNCWVNNYEKNYNFRKTKIQKLISDYFTEKTKKIIEVDDSIDLLKNKIKSTKKSNLSIEEKTKEINKLLEEKTKFQKNKRSISMDIDKKFLENYNQIIVDLNNIKKNSIQNNLDKENK